MLTSPLVSSTILFAVECFFFLTECPVQVNPDLKSHFEEKGFRFVGQDVEGERMEVIELDGMKNTRLLFIL